MVNYKIAVFFISLLMPGTLNLSASARGIEPKLQAKPIAEEKRKSQSQETSQAALKEAGVPASSSSKKNKRYDEKVYSEINSACIKNSKKELANEPSNKEVCACSVRRTLDALSNDDRTEKEFKTRVSWLKKMYDVKLSSEDVEKDPYDIFEINVSITNECVSELSASLKKKANK